MATVVTSAPIAPEIVFAGLTDGINLRPPINRPAKKAPVSLDQVSSTGNTTTSAPAVSPMA